MPPWKQCEDTNNVAIYGGITVEDDVFSDLPRAHQCVQSRSQVSRKSIYEKTLIKRGATIGANATIVCGITLGRYCFVGAGAVVTKDIPDYGIVLGNPGKLLGYMSRHGHKLHFMKTAICPESNYRYKKAEDELRCLDLDEDKPLQTDFQ